MATDDVTGGQVRVSLLDAGDKVSSAEDFIRELAAESSVSGQPLPGEVGGWRDPKGRGVPLGSPGADRRLARAPLPDRSRNGTGFPKKPVDTPLLP